MNKDFKYALWYSLIQFVLSGAFGVILAPLGLWQIIGGAALLFGITMCSSSFGKHMERATR